MLYALNRERELEPDYRRASAFALLATALKALIVVTLITKLFGDDSMSHANELASYCRRWNTLNVVAHHSELGL